MPGRDLDDGEAQLLIERFALTANNVSYAALGDELGYWRIFPSPGGWGRIPAWGYARVVASRSPALVEGQRVYGLVPMASYLTVRPEPNRLGFVDTSPHRADLSSVYNQYMGAADDGDDMQLVMRPLFGTSVLLDLELAEAGADSGQTVLVTSASAKTAYGLAYLLAERPTTTIGFTSGTRRAWVERLGVYDAVLAYDETDQLHAAEDVVLVDFTGDRRLVGELHERLGERLVRSNAVGFTHRRAGDETPMPGPAPEFFFAPEKMKGRGPELAQRYAEAWQGFAHLLQGTLQIRRVSDGDELLRVYRDLVEGRADPAAGYVAGLPG
jgi:hypothetical protein